MTVKEFVDRLQEFVRSREDTALFFAVDDSEEYSLATSITLHKILDGDSDEEEHFVINIT